MLKFYCPCGSFFESEEVLEHHILNHKHIFFNKEKNNIESILEKIKKHFPDYNVDVFEGKGNYASFEIVLNVNNSSICQRLGNVTDGSDRYPEDLENAIKELEIKVSIVEQLYSRINSLNVFSLFQLIDFRYDYSGETYINVNFEVNNESFYKDFRISSFDSKNIVDYFESDFENELNLFILNLTPFYIDTFEGEIEIVSVEGYDSIFISNDSVKELNITPLFERSNNIKIEILEVK